MKRALFLLILVFTCMPLAWSQVVVPRDTSFTISTTLIKEKKYRPYISVADPEKPAHVVIKENVVYRKIGERTLLADIYYPKKTKHKKPAVLMIFGGGWRSGDKSQNRAMAIELAKHGYVAVSVEYRLSPEAIYPAAVQDLKAAVAWMRCRARQYGIDTSKIAALGCSAGGQLAALLGTTGNSMIYKDSIGGGGCVSDKVNAVVDIDGVLAFKHPESAEGAVAAQWLGGTASEKLSTWQEASAITHVDAASAPVLFINSSLPRFHAGRDDMIRKMNAFGIYSEIHELPDTPHPFWFFHPWFNTVIRHTVTFLNKVFVYEYHP